MVKFIVPEVASLASDLKKLALSIPSRVVALTLVKFAPLTAGNVDGKRASGIVPDAIFDAFNAVKVEPSPINVLPLATLICSEDVQASVELTQFHVLFVAPSKVSPPPSAVASVGVETLPISMFLSST